jgi:hypothetical protein
MEADDEGVTAANGQGSSTEADNFKQTGESDQESTGSHSPEPCGKEISLDEESRGAVDSGVTADDVDPKRVARVIRHHIDNDDLEGSRKKAYINANNSVLIYLCELLGINYSHINLNKNTAKSQLFQAVISTISYTSISLTENVTLLIYITISR